jgi:hypothetical protein
MVKRNKTRRGGQGEGVFDLSSLTTSFNQATSGLTKSFSERADKFKNQASSLPAEASSWTTGWGAKLQSLNPLTSAQPPTSIQQQHLPSYTLPSTQPPLQSTQSMPSSTSTQPPLQSTQSMPSSTSTQSRSSVGGKRSKKSSKKSRNPRKKSYKKSRKLSKKSRK